MIRRLTRTSVSRSLARDSIGGRCSPKLWCSEMPTATHHRGYRFVLNILWSWMGVAAGLFTGLLLSPYMIHKLGAEGYGVWAISFSLVEYCGFLDLGFRSAIVKYVA